MPCANMQLEFIALSRSVPAAFAWLVTPYIKSFRGSNFLRDALGELIAAQVF